MEKSKKKKLAIWTHGGIGGGLFGQGFPMIVQIVERLANHYNITVYSAASIPKHFEANGYKVCSPSPKIKLLWLKWFYIVLFFLKNHLISRYEVLYSFWGYPSGTAIVALGNILNRPSVVNILGAESADLPEIKYGFLRKNSRRKILWTLTHATEVIAVSKYQIKKLEEKGFHRKIVLIPWGVDSNQFYNITRKPESTLRILHVANLNEVKDQETLLKAFKIIRKEIPAKLRIVGADYLNGKIQRLAVEMGLQAEVEFTGAIPNEQMNEHYHWADVFMLTSLSEGQNNSVTEAMACGVLPASTRVGIMHDLGDEAGIVVDPGDYQQLASKLLALYNDSGEWEKRRKVALTWASIHNLDWTITQLVSVFDSVAIKHSSKDYR